MRRLLSLCLLLCLSLPATMRAADDKTNWVLDPSFETNAGWGRQANAEGRKGGPALHLANEKAGWNQAFQSIAFGAVAPASIEVACWVRTAGVKPGRESWEKARLNLTFHDKAGTQVGGWPAAVCTVEGDSPWTRYANSYPVPSGAASVKLSA